MCLIMAIFVTNNSYANNNYSPEKPGMSDYSPAKKPNTDDSDAIERINFTKQIMQQGIPVSIEIKKWRSDFIKEESLKARFPEPVVVVANYSINELSNNNFVSTYLSEYKNILAREIEWLKQDKDKIHLWELEKRVFTALVATLPQVEQISHPFGWRYAYTDEQGGKWFLGGQLATYQQYPSGNYNDFFLVNEKNPYLNGQGKTMDLMESPSQTLIKIISEARKNNNEFRKNKVEFLQYDFPEGAKIGYIGLYPREHRDFFEEIPAHYKLHQFKYTPLVLRQAGYNVMHAIVARANDPSNFLEKQIRKMSEDNINAIWIDMYGHGSQNGTIDLGVGDNTEVNGGKFKKILQNFSQILFYVRVASCHGAGFRQFFADKNDVKNITITLSSKPRFTSYWFREMSTINHAHPRSTSSTSEMLFMDWAFMHKGEKIELPNGEKFDVDTLGSAIIYGDLSANFYYPNDPDTIMAGKLIP